MKENYLKFIDEFIEAFDEKLRVNDIEYIRDTILDEAKLNALDAVKGTELFEYLSTSGTLAFQYFLLDELGIDIFRNTKIKSDCIYYLPALPKKLTINFPELANNQNHRILFSYKYPNSKVIYSPEEFQLFWPDIILPNSTNTCLDYQSIGFIRNGLAKPAVPLADFNITLSDNITLIDPSFFDNIKRLNLENVHFLFKPTTDGRLPFEVPKNSIELVKKYFRPY